jgi:hypothetical protein
MLPFKSGDLDANDERRKLHKKVSSVSPNPKNESR